MHPFFKSFIVIILFGIIIFFAQELILSQSSFLWIEEIGEGSINQLTKKIICNFSLSSIISLSFTLPCLFFNKVDFGQFIKWAIGLSLFTWILLIIIANDFAHEFFLFQWIKLMIPFMDPPVTLFSLFFPVGIFLITRAFFNVTLKLFLLLLLVFPFAMGIDSLDLLRKLFAFPSSTDFNLFFSICFLLNFISNFYFRNLNYQEPIPIDENILDTPDI